MWVYVLEHLVPSRWCCLEAVELLGNWTLTQGSESLGLGLYPF